MRGPRRLARAPRAPDRGRPQRCPARPRGPPSTTFRPGRTARTSATGRPGSASRSCRDSRRLRVLGQPFGGMAHQDVASVLAGVGDNKTQESLQGAADDRPRPNIELRDQIIAADREISEGQWRICLQLVVDPLAQLVELSCTGRKATADVVGRAQIEKIVDQVTADSTDEASDRGSAPARLVVEHVLADERRDPIYIAPRK